MLTEEVVRHFSRHLVALTLFYRQREDTMREVRFASYSGTVISFRGFWFFLTAGHVLEGIDEKLPGIEVLRWRLNDNFTKGDSGDQGIPFSYAESNRHYVHDLTHGSDYGFIELADLECQLLRANGIQAIEEKDWTRIDELQFDFYMMLGIPEEALRESPGSATQKRVRVNATLVYVEPVPHPEDVSKPQVSWFVGHLREKDAPKSIVGMSGGPILGFKMTDQGLKYWLVALQSWWDKKRRITFGCRIQPFAERMSAYLQQLLEELNKT